MARLRKRKCIAGVVCGCLVFLMISQTLLSRHVRRMLNEGREQHARLSALVPVPSPILESNLIKIDAFVSFYHNHLLSWMVSLYPIHVLFCSRV